MRNVYRRFELGDHTEDVVLVDLLEFKGEIGIEGVCTLLNYFDSCSGVSDNVKKLCTKDKDTIKKLVLELTEYVY